MRLRCSIPNASGNISGVAFERTPFGDLISEEITDEAQVKRFLSIQGFSVYEPPKPSQVPVPDEADDVPGRDKEPDDDGAKTSDEDGDLEEDLGDAALDGDVDDTDEQASQHGDEGGHGQGADELSKEPTAGKAAKAKQKQKPKHKK